MGGRGVALVLLSRRTRGESFLSRLAHRVNFALA